LKENEKMKIKVLRIKGNEHLKKELSDIESENLPNHYLEPDTALAVGLQSHVTNHI